MSPESTIYLIQFGFLWDSELMELYANPKYITSTAALGRSAIFLNLVGCSSDYLRAEEERSCAYLRHTYGILRLLSYTIIPNVKISI